jgi:putative dimethyl sulfoxide reductase chaperone
LYLCFAQVYLPPREERHYEALVRDLPIDLEELLPGLESGQRLAELVGEVPGHASLLRAYSRLFLVPPFRTPLNAGLYLDGSLMGPSVAEMEQFYARHGLGRRSHFRDTSDHLAVQLQFVAMLLASAAQAKDESGARYYFEEVGSFVGRFMISWIPDWVRRMEHESGEHAYCKPYAFLGAVVRDALADDLAWLEARVPAKWSKAATRAITQPPASLPPPGAASAQQIQCRLCGRDYLPAEELAAMIQALQQEGLEVEHLTVCPDCRFEAMGLHPFSPSFREA